MKRVFGILAAGVVFFAVAAPIAAQPSVVASSHAAVKADLALALVKVADPSAAVTDTTPAAAFARMQSALLAPGSWRADDVLTQGDLARVANRIGVSMTPTDPSKAVTTADLDAFTLRELQPRQDAISTTMSAGRVFDPILNEPPDRFISASDF